MEVGGHVAVDHVLHLRERCLGPGAIQEDQEDHPLDLVQGHASVIDGKDAVDDQFTADRIQNAVRILPTDTIDGFFICLLEKI